MCARARDVYKRQDLSDAEQVMRLPSAQNIVYMVGKKFGTQDCEYETWASNVLLPSQVLHRFQACLLDTSRCV